MSLSSPTQYSYGLEPGWGLEMRCWEANSGWSTELDRASGRGPVNSRVDC